MFTDRLDNLIACPKCDALRLVEDPRTRLSCERCHTVLIAPVRAAGLKLIILSAISLILVAGAATQPFITIKKFMLANDVTLIEAAFSFSGPQFALSLAVLTIVLVLPFLRLVLSVYVLTPLVADKKPLPYAIPAFRLFELLRPWSMAEVFALGAAVSLFKIADIASITLGPAFWMFCLLVLASIAQNTLMCRWSVWKALEA